MKSRTTSRTRTQPPVVSPTRSTEPTGSSARDHYNREKARRAKRALPENEAMAAARREYLAMLEADAAKGKGGRPRKNAVKRSPIKDEIDDEAAEHEDAEVEHDADAEEHAEAADDE